MDRNKLESLEQVKQQRLLKRSRQQAKQANLVNQRQTKGKTVENIDTIGQKSPKWMMSTLIAVGVIAAVAAGIGSQLKVSMEKENTAVNAPPTISTNKQAGTEQILLEQAQLLANQGQPQQLAEAIALLQTVPANTAVNAQGQSLTSVWGQQILQAARTQANGGDLTVAIATANLIPGNSEAHQSAQQQILQWQQQQQQAQQQQFAAELAEASKPLPVTAPILPPPPPVVTEFVAPQTPVITQENTSVTISPAIASNNQTQVQPATQTQPTIASATKTEVQTATPPKRATTNEQTQLLAQDPYLNVKIDPVQVPQLQKRPVVSTTGSSGASRGNYGFQNLTVYAPTVAIQLRDNVDEDGDYVSLIINGQVYTQNELIVNRGRVMMVDLQPGENRVDIIGVKDGEGGITLEVNVAGIGNINNRPIPEGYTASFIINRAE